MFKFNYFKNIDIQINANMTLLIGNKVINSKYSNCFVSSIWQYASLFLQFLTRDIIHGNQQTVFKTFSRDSTAMLCAVPIGDSDNVG